MKKTFTLFVIASLMVSNVQGQTRGTDESKDYVLRTLTFEDKDYKGTEDNAKTYWSDLIPASEYGNGNGRDSWYDENNTLLTHSFTAPYWSGGHAISNFTNPGYAPEDLPEGIWGWYELQFANLVGGNNGSKNFCVHMGYVDEYNSTTGMCPELQKITFADGKARVIDHMYVTNICYVLNSLVHGDGFNPPANDTTTFSILAIGYDAQGNEVGSTSFTLFQGLDSVVTTWQKWDLSILGEVVSVGFNMIGSRDLYGDWGLNAPGYFAYDDVAVRFDKNDLSALPNTFSPSADANCKKVLRNGQILIIRDGKTYTIDGKQL